MEHTSVSISNQQFTSIQKRRSSHLKAVVGLLALAAVVATFAVFSYAPSPSADSLKSTDSTATTNCTLADYEAWKVEHNRTPNAQEDSHRYKLWCKTHQIIIDHNAQNLSYQLGHSDFSDMTQDEAEASSTGRIEGDDVDSDNSSNTTDPTKLLLATTLTIDWKNPVPVPVDVDWRAKGVVTPAKNQGHCGSCWAFAATAALEGLHAIKTGTLQSFSEQYIIDCASKKNGWTVNGCGGGYEGSGFLFGVRKGIHIESNYPYKAKTGECRTDISTPLTFPPIKKFNTVKPNSVPHLLAQVALAPVMVVISTPKQFMHYKSGILTNPDVTRISHAVTIVGYHLDNKSTFTTSGVPMVNITTDETDLTGYWIVKNSWGSGWGEKGFVRVAMTGGNDVGTLHIQHKPLSGELVSS